MTQLRRSRFVPDANSQIKLFNNGELIGLSTADNDGEWEITTNNLTDGTYNLTAIATDITGNISDPSTPLTITIDTQINPPSNLDLVAHSVSGTSNTDNITNDTTPMISGVSDANSSVKLFNNGELIGLSTVGSDGQWEITTNNLTDGTHNLTAIATR